MDGELLGREYRAVEQELLYCRQFILGPAFIDVAPNWKQLDPGTQLKLSGHPELEVEPLSAGERQGLSRPGAPAAAPLPRAGDGAQLPLLAARADRYAHPGGR